MDINAKIDLNSIKIEISNEFGHNYNNITDKAKSNTSQNTLMEHAKNVFAGEEVEVQVSKKLV